MADTTPNTSVLTTSLLKMLIELPQPFLLLGLLLLLYSCMSCRCYIQWRLQLLTIIFLMQEVKMTQFPRSRLWIRSEKPTLYCAWLYYFVRATKRRNPLLQTKPKPFAIAVIRSWTSRAALAAFRCRMWINKTNFAKVNVELCVYNWWSSLIWAIKLKSTNNWK